MHRILGRTSGHVVEIEISDALTPEDYAELVGEIEGLIARHGKSHLLWDLTALERSDFNALWDEATFAVDHAGDVLRIALVGPRKWEEWSDALLEPFENAEVRYFGNDGQDDAMTWLAET